MPPMKPASDSGIQAGKRAQIINHAAELETHKDTVPELDAGELANNNTNQEIYNVQNPEDNLTLHNTFESLELEIEQGIEEDVPNDKESNPTELDMQIDKNPSGAGSSQGKKHLTDSTTSEDHCNLVKRASKTVTLSSGTSPVSYGTGNTIYPIIVEAPILQPIISPIITMDENLGQDKRQNQYIDGPKNTAAVCKKDGKLFNKFWGDEKTDATDSSPETDYDPQTTAPSNISKYLVSGTVTKSKRGRPKKRKSPQNKVGSKSPDQGKENIYTRSQTSSKLQVLNNINQ